MPKIPCEQIWNGVDGANGEVHGVFGGFFRNGTRREKGLSQAVDSGIDRQPRQRFDEMDALGSCCRITLRAFQLGEAGCDQIEGTRFAFPPNLGDFLACACDHLARGS